MGDRTEQDLQRRALRVLRMVGELHKRGYQKARIVPGMSPSGMYWRCSVLPASHVSVRHGAMFADPESYWREPALGHYTTGMNNEYFGWKDATKATAPMLADLFLQRLPQLAVLMEGRDWPYAGWYVEMLGVAERGAFPVSYADYYDVPDPRYLPTTAGAGGPSLPMPPPGEGRADNFGEPAC